MRSAERGSAERRTLRERGGAADKGLSSPGREKGLVREKRLGGQKELAGENSLGWQKRCGRG